MTQLAFDFTAAVMRSDPKDVIQAPPRTNRVPPRDWRAEASLTKDLVRLASQVKQSLSSRCGHAQKHGLRKRFRDLYGEFRTALPYAWEDEQIGAAAGMLVYKSLVSRWLEVQGWKISILGGDDDEYWTAGFLPAWFRERKMGPTESRLWAFEHDVMPTDSHPLFGDFWTSTIGPLFYGPSIREPESEMIFDFWRGRPLPASFATPGDTWYVGDAYQHLSDSSRNRQALVQTPDFVVEFILDRTYSPAIAEFGLRGLRAMDPACGTGHFLTAGFRRLTAAWENEAPTSTPTEIARAALGSIYGIEINPFTADLARWRLKTEALTYAGIAGRESRRNPPEWVHVVDKQILWADGLLPLDHPMQPFNQDVHDAHLGPTREVPR